MTIIVFSVSLMVMVGVIAYLMVRKDLRSKWERTDKEIPQEGGSL